jgi:hypothetical protein
MVRGQKMRVQAPARFSGHLTFPLCKVGDSLEAITLVTAAHVGAREVARGNAFTSALSPG